MQTERPAVTLAGRYVLEDELGRSASGVLWRAHDTVLDRVVAVKIFRPELADDPVAAERLASDIGAAARVTAPGLAAVLDSGTEAGVSFIVREHVDGESLRSRLERSGPLPPTEAVPIAIAVLRALGVAHRAGLLHLDLKPENVLLADDGAIRLSDLGVGAAVRETRPRAGAEILEPAVTPPELVDGGAPDERTDVFGVAAVLFEALTGVAPDQRRSPRALVAAVPRALDRVVARALDPDRDARFADAETFARALASLETAPAADERPSVRSWILVPALVIVAVASAVAVGLWAGRLELGGPLGVRVAEPEPSRPSPRPVVVAEIPIVSAAAFDPFGDDSENDSTAPRAIDGDTATAWRSENYFDGDLRKPGFGLLLDLGRQRTVSEVRLVVPHPGWRFGISVGDDPIALAEATAPTLTAQTEMETMIDPATGRYVLVWIVSVVDAGDGNRAEVAEIGVSGPDA